MPEPKTEGDLIAALIAVQDAAGPKTALSLTRACQEVLRASVGVEEPAVIRATKWAMERAEQRAQEAQALEDARKAKGQVGTGERDHERGTAEEPF